MRAYKVYAGGPLQLLPQRAEEPLFLTVADQLTGPDRLMLRDVLQEAWLQSSKAGRDRRIERLARRLGVELDWGAVKLGGA